MATSPGEASIPASGAGSPGAADAARPGAGQRAGNGAVVGAFRPDPEVGRISTTTGHEPRVLVRRLVIAFVLTVVLVPLLALVLPRVSYHRLMGRAFLLCVLVTWLPAMGPPRTWFEGLRRLGLRGPSSLRRAVSGALLSMLVFSGIVAVSLLLGGRQALGGVAADWPSHLVKAAIAGIGVSLLEELMWRGYLRGVLGAVSSSLLYATAHYFRPIGHSDPAGGPYDPLLALRRFPEMVESWAEPRHVTFGLLSLFLFALALCHLRRRTGSLWPCMGVHFGAVFAIEIYRDYVDRDATGSLWLYGGTRLHDGLVGCLGVVLLFWLLSRWRVAKE